MKTWNKNNNSFQVNRVDMNFNEINKILLTSNHHQIALSRSENSKKHAQWCIVSFGFFLKCYPVIYVLTHTQFKYNWRINSCKSHRDRYILNIPLHKLLLSFPLDFFLFSCFALSVCRRTCKVLFHFVLSAGHMHRLAIPIGKSEKCSLHIAAEWLACCQCCVRRSRKWMSSSRPVE